MSSVSILSTSVNDMSWLTHDTYEQTESLLFESSCGSLGSAASGDAILFRLSESSAVLHKKLRNNGVEFLHYLVDRGKLDARVLEPTLAMIRDL